MAAKRLGCAIYAGERRNFYREQQTREPDFIFSEAIETKRLRTALDRSLAESYSARLEKTADATDAGLLSLREDAAGSSRHFFFDEKKLRIPRGSGRSLCKLALHKSIKAGRFSREQAIRKTPDNRNANFSPAMIHLSTRCHL